MSVSSSSPSSSPKRNWHCACKPGLLGPPVSSLPSTLHASVENCTNGPPSSWRLSQTEDSTLMVLNWSPLPYHNSPTSFGPSFPPALLTVIGTFNAPVSSWNISSDNAVTTCNIIWSTISCSPCKPSTPVLQNHSPDLGYCSVSPSSSPATPPRSYIHDVATRLSFDAPATSSIACQTSIINQTTGSQTTSLLNASMTSTSCQTSTSTSSSSCQTSNVHFVSTSTSSDDLPYQIETPLIATVDSDSQTSTLVMRNSKTQTMTAVDNDSKIRPCVLCNLHLHTNFHAAHLLECPCSPTSKTHLTNFLNHWNKKFPRNSLQYLTPLLLSLTSDMADHDSELDSIADNLRDLIATAIPADLLSTFQTELNDLLCNIMLDIFSNNGYEEDEELSTLLMTLSPEDLLQDEGSISTLNSNNNIGNCADKLLEFFDENDLEENDDELHQQSYDTYDDTYDAYDDDACDDYFDGQLC